ncbi:MAG: sugar transferase [Candidatus Sumerlaeia bacterium]|nr:sugar transferase [Candidatus Sumerlaeia bacterium]
MKAASRLDTAAKCLMDYLLGAALLLAALPLFFLVAVAIKLDSRGPVFYRRRVVGRGGREFDAFKFRTMRADADAMLAAHPEWAMENTGGRKRADDPRVTRLGRWLRRTSLNELPQLFNVLLGQMSLVGPRMATAAELAGHDAWREVFDRVKPGLTGLWQVSGRNDLPLDERIRLDREYVAHRNIVLDVRILFQTIPAVLRARGAR